MNIMILIIALIFLVCGLVHAADVGTYNYTTSPDLSSTAITQFNTSSNTTSSYKIDSIIYDSPFNLTSQHPEYKLTLAISEQATLNISDSSITESLIFVTPPADSGVGAGNSSSIRDWNSCAVVFKRVTDAATKRGENEDGGCFPTLGEACIDALYAQVSENSDGSISCQSLVTEIPTECGDAIQKDREDIFSFDLNSSSNSTRSIPLLLTESEPHKPTNKSYYDEASHRIWPVLIYQKVTSGSSNAEQGSASTQIKCLRDVKAERRPSGTETSSPTPTPTSSDKPGLGITLSPAGGMWGLVLMTWFGNL
ncbi:hypothetical protein BKA65DRAFT_498359 [Rhexocercosporidium sp. MPI-PUGE-AT-0058]|nr:hypothetical protein BKA65DRAFT_498359 [Rhexocercosporidium sp. MPI-PUGE-AT-0058]